jgi:hypothetical protein
VQLVVLKEPVELDENVTVPVGVNSPTPESATVTVQVDATLSGTLDGEHDTAVVVDRIVESRENAVLVLVA